MCVCVTSEVTCEAEQLVSGTLTTPHDVTFSDVIDGQCPDGQRQLMDNGLRFDSVKCTAYGRSGQLNSPQSNCQPSVYIMLFNDNYISAALSASYRFTVLLHTLRRTNLTASSRDERECLFNPILSHSQWLIPIPILNPKFSLVLFPFPLVIPIHSRSHSGTASSISIRQQMTGKLNNAHN